MVHDARDEESSAGHWHLSALSIAALIGIIVVYGILVVSAVNARGNIWHDEAASILAATGHQDDWYRIEFDGAEPYGSWASASEYQSLLRVDRPFDLQGVSRSVADHDFHPPFSYWLLHIALVAGLPLLWAGPVVNILAGGILAVVLFLLVSRLVRSTRAALTAVAASLWSPAIVLAGAEARHYIVLALMVVALGAVSAWIVAARGERSAPSVAQLAGFAVVTTIGMLTHHQFFFFAVAAAGIIWLAGYFRSWRPAVKIGGALIVGVGVATLLFPYLVPHSTRLQSILPPIDLTAVPGRMSLWLTRTFDVVSLDRDLTGLFRFLSRSLIVVAVITVVVMHRPILRWARGVPEQAAVVVLSVVTILIPAVAYAFGRAPDHALGIKYVGALWPLAVAALVIVAVAISPRGWIAVAVVAGVALLSTVQWIGDVRVGGESTTAMLSEIAAADAVVTDCASRGNFPTIVHGLDPETPVYLATGEDLMAAIDDGWMAPDGSVYFLHGSCPDADDVFGALARAGVREPTRAGAIERYEVWRWER